MKTAIAGMILYFLIIALFIGSVVYFVIKGISHVSEVGLKSTIERIWEGNKDDPTTDY